MRELAGSARVRVNPISDWGRVADDPTGTRELGTWARCQLLIVRHFSNLYAGLGVNSMFAQSLLPFLALAIPGAFGQISLYGPVTNRPHAGDPAPDLTFSKTLSSPAGDSWSPQNLAGQLTVLVFYPDTTQNLQFVLVLPEHESQEKIKDRLRNGLADYFHVNVTREDRLVDAYVLSLASNGKLPPTKPRADDGMGGIRGSSVRYASQRSLDDAIAGPKPQPLGAIRGIFADGTADELCHTLEYMLDRPMVNETHLKGEFVFRIDDNGGEENNFLGRLREQLGLVIAPAQRNVESLLIEPR